MDIQKLIAELDELYAAGRLPEAGEKLSVRLQEAHEENDDAAALLIYNEMMGLYRETGHEQEAVSAGRLALALVDRMGISGSVEHGTTLLNAATANRTAGRLEDALGYYRAAEAIYLAHGKTRDHHLASLYNNISHLYQELGRRHEALECLIKSKDIIDEIAPGGPEAATARVNLALACIVAGAAGDAETLLREAFEYYESERGRGDGHYGAALTAWGELCMLRGSYAEARELFERALDFTLARFGECRSSEILRQDIERARAAPARDGDTA